jgi:hypothetical protein
MGAPELPEDPSIAEMIRWISDRYDMTKADLDAYGPHFLP